MLPPQLFFFCGPGIASSLRYPLSHHHILPSAEFPWMWNVQSPPAASSCNSIFCTHLPLLLHRMSPTLLSSWCSSCFLCRAACNSAWQSWIYCICGPRTEAMWLPLARYPTHSSVIDGEGWIIKACKFKSRFCCDQLSLNIHLVFDIFSLSSQTTKLQDFFIFSSGSTSFPFVPDIWGQFQPVRNRWWALDEYLGCTESCPALYLGGRSLSPSIPLGPGGVHRCNGGLNREP